jgi:DNA repair proteins
MSKENLHKNHRKRVKERYLGEGLDNFSIHNIVELMLFYTIPQKDVNEIAHKLVNHYKTFSNILDADYNDLLRHEGIGENTALFLKLLPDLFRQYSMSKVNAGMACEKIDRVAEFLIGYYTAITKEIVVLVLLNNKNEMIDCVKIHEGSMSSAMININTIAEIVYTRKAANFILAHNHPDGDPTPSSEDIMATRMITNAFSMFDAKLFEHYVVSGTRYRTIITDK